MPVVACLVLIGQSHAQEDVCSSFDWPLAREYGLLSARDIQGRESGDAVRFGEAAALALRAPDEVTFARPPERAPKVSPSFAGVLRIEPPAKGGPVQITLSEDAWIDVVQNDAAVRSSAFTGKRGCAGMRKSVRFELTGGPAVVQISGAATQRLNIVVTPADR